MSEPTQALAYARQNHARFLAELKEFLAIPSISTLSTHKPDIQRAAEWAAQHLTASGLQNVAVLPTGGHPAVWGEWSGAPGRPTVLIYGHYDVQPIDPLNEWQSPPFSPTVRGENLYARGASDMKGQFLANINAVEALLKTGALRCNLKILLEGEEEIGSPNLEAFILAHRDQLKCDVALVADVNIPSPTQPALIYGLRGLAYFELQVYGPAQDLHSGSFGGGVHNPAQVLCELLAGLHDAQGRVTLPGYYDRVRALPEDERADLERGATPDAEWRRIASVPQLYGEAGFTTTERLGARPTLEVNGLLSGFTGEGSKTVLPAKAMAKISMRLVPYQDDKAVEGQLREYLQKNAPPSVRWELKNLTTAPAVLVQRDSPAMRAAQAAQMATFGVAPLLKLEGGSVPVVATFQAQLGVDTILMGIGLPDDNLHSPNEKLYLPNFYRGIEAYLRFFDLLAQ